MTRACVVTGKRTKVGYKYSIRGIAKKQKGIGLKITGKTKRTFKPNIVKKRFWNPEDKKFITLKVSTKAMRIIDKKGLNTVLREIKKAA
jgi:large subunit ribosomal protein L28